MMNTIEIKKEPLYWIELTRTVAIFLVILIHVASPVFNNWAHLPESWRIFANIYETIARMSVPLFFMSSGYLLLQRSESIRDFFVKRVNKVLLPFIVWSIVYLFWGCGFSHNSCEGDVLSRLILIRGTSYHLWFIYPLLGLYLITPVLRLLIVPDHKYILWYFIGLWIIFQSILSPMQELWNLRTAITVPMATGYVGFFILGYLLGEWTLSPKVVLVSTILWILSTAATVLVIHFLNIHSEEFQGSFYDYLGINVIAISAAGFILFRWLAGQPWISSGWIPQLVHNLAKASFGIYLVHLLVLDVLASKNPFFHMKATIGNPAWTIPLISFLVFSISFFVVYVMQRIPLVKKIVP